MHVEMRVFPRTVTIIMAKKILKIKLILPRSILMSHSNDKKIYVSFKLPIKFQSD